MFDTYQGDQIAPAYPQEIHHHLAPTAEHLRLLREMQASVRAQAVFETGIADNVFGALMRSSVDDTHETILRFSLNGKQYGVRVAMAKEISMKKEEFCARRSPTCC